MKVALAHHWLTQHRGGEKVLEQMASLFPGSDIYTLFHDLRLQIPGLSGHAVKPSILNRIPHAARLYRHLLPAFPWAIQRMRVADDVDVLLSSDASLIKGISMANHTKHICYCHSPPRYLWEMGDEYKRASIAARIALDQFAPMLRRFDHHCAKRVTHFIANSHFVANRISKYYQRDSQVIYPPVAVEQFACDRKRESFALVISELVAYKRIDIAVRAFNRLGKRLVIIGDGPERKNLQSFAGANIEFLGRQPFARLKAHYESASAFIFPGIEDFGITPVEAQAAGCPVIAFRGGGALESVMEGRTGLFFDEQNSESLADAVERFDSCHFDPVICARHAASFSADRFCEELSTFLRANVSDQFVTRRFSDSIRVAG